MSKLHQRGAGASSKAKKEESIKKEEDRVVVEDDVEDEEDYEDDDDGDEDEDEEEEEGEREGPEVSNGGGKAATATAAPKKKTFPWDRPGANGADGCCGGGPTKGPTRKKKAAGAGAGGQEEEKSKGIRWLPLVFLMFMMGPAIVGGLDFLLGLPFFAKFRAPPDTRQCLINYYRQVNPERLNEINVDDILAKYKGKERAMIRNLEGRYGRPWKCG